MYYGQDLLTLSDLRKCLKGTMRVTIHPLKVTFKLSENSMPLVLLKKFNLTILLFLDKTHENDWKEEPAFHDTLSFG